MSFLPFLFSLHYFAFHISPIAFKTFYRTWFSWPKLSFQSKAYKEAFIKKSMSLSHCLVYSTLYDTLGKGNIYKGINASLNKVTVNHCFVRTNSLKLCCWSENLSHDSFLQSKIGHKNFPLRNMYISCFPGETPFNENMFFQCSAKVRVRDRK